MLRRFAWSSVPSASFSAAALEEIVASARRNNERHHVSGMMLFTDAHVLGVREGAEWDLVNLWQKLGRDERHRKLRRIGDVLCGDRRFPQWMMSRTDDAVVHAQIEVRRSPQASSPAAGWAEVIRPIMRHAGAVSL